MTTQQPGSSGFHWRSEEDYFIARLAVSMGILDEAAIEECMRLQGMSYANGQPLSLSQVMVRTVNLPPHALMRLKSELVRCHHSCTACGYGRYLAPGPQDRTEPCPKCGGAIPVPATGSSMTGTRQSAREQALNVSGSFQMSEQRDPLAVSGQGPTLFGNYVLDEEIARGAMGAVYRVRHTDTGDPYALKVLLAGTKATDKQIHRFKREAKAQMELDHPNIVKIHDAGEWEGILFYAMDIIEGTDLDDFKTIEREDRYRIMAKVCRAIHYAHEHGYVHRDLKPANILICKEGEPLVTDFGLTKNLDGTTQLTQEGAIMGTPFYMSPEQACGQAKKMGPRSDIFALGVLLYQMVTNELPFRGESAAQLYSAIISADPEPFSEHDVVAPKLEQVTLKAIEKEPELRYATALELAEDIERILAGESPLASGVSSASRIVLKVEQHKRSIGFMLGMVMLGLVGLVGLLLAGKVAYKKTKESQAFEEREGNAKATIAALDLALSGAESIPPREAQRSLDEALSASADLLAGGTEVPSLARLRVRRGEALVSSAALSMRLGTGNGAKSALARLDEADGLDEEANLIALDLRARACWRLGRNKAAEAAVVALAQAAPHDPRVALLAALRARLAGEHEQALTALADATTVRAALERGHALFALGKDAEAAKILAAAEAIAKPSERLHLRWGEALLALGRASEAAAAFSVALERDPSSLTAARRLSAVSLTLGRPMELGATLAKAVKRQSGLMELEVERLRARLCWDREASQKAEAKLGELAALPDAALLLGDLAAAAGESDPYAALAADDPRHAATAARRRVEHGQEPGDLAPLRALMDDVPFDVPPDPRLARAVRDLGWVYLAKGQSDEALAAAEAALRGLPGDLDACFLLRAIDAKHAPRLAAAFVAEADELQGALGRGLLLSRVARVHGLKNLVEPARRLLRMRLAGHPSLWVVRAELARLATFAGTKTEIPSAPEGAPDWTVLLPPIPDRSLSKKDKRRAHKLATKAEGAEARRGQAAQGEKWAREALAIDPYNWLALHALAHLTVYQRGREDGRNRLLLFSELEVRPGYAYRQTLKFMREWVEDSKFGTQNTPADEARIVIGDDPERGLNHTLWIMDRYLGLFYPDSENPTWTYDTDPRVITRRIGLVLRKSPLMTAFLYHHAHLLTLQRRLAEADRDLAVLDQVVVAVPEIGTCWDWIFRAWILADYPARAWVYLDKLVNEKIGRRTPKEYMGKTVGKLRYWFEHTSSLRPLLTDPRWVEFDRAFFGNERKKQR